MAARAHGDGACDERHVARDGRWGVGMDPSRPTVRVVLCRPARLPSLTDGPKVTAHNSRSMPVWAELASSNLVVRSVPSLMSCRLAAGDGSTGSGLSSPTAIVFTAPPTADIKLPIALSPLTPPFVSLTAVSDESAARWVGVWVGGGGGDQASVRARGRGRREQIEAAAIALTDRRA